RLVKQRLSREKKKYFDHQLSNANNSQALWNDLRSLGLVKRKNTQTEINIDLNELNDYCCVFLSKLNCLKLNASKTQAIIFGSKTRVNSDICKSASNIVVSECTISYSSVGYQQLFSSDLEFLPVAMRRGDVRQDYLRLPQARTMIYDYSFLIHGIRVWNSLPAEVVAAGSFDEFRNICFNFLLENEL
ncbi:Protein of unknown function, partial [Cotesia congregata]